MQQCMELTGTNRSRAYPNTTHQSDEKLTKLSPITLAGPGRDEGQTQMKFRIQFSGDQTWNEDFKLQVFSEV